MKTYKSYYNFQSIKIDTTNVTSECNTISFMNKGNGIVYIKSSANPNLLPINSLETLTLGGRIESIVADTFEISFETGKTNNLQIVRENIIHY